MTEWVVEIFYSAHTRAIVPVFRRPPDATRSTPMLFERERTPEPKDLPLPPPLIPPQPEGDDQEDDGDETLPPSVVYH